MAKSKEIKIDELIRKAGDTLELNVDYLHDLAFSATADQARDIKEESTALASTVNALLKIKDDMRNDIEKAKLQELKDDELLKFIAKSLPYVLQDLDNAELQAFYDAVELEIQTRKVNSFSKND